MFERNCLAINVAEALQALQESAQIDSFFFSASRMPQHTNARDFSRRLRPRA
jgi:hypothetical protein